MVICKFFQFKWCNWILKLCLSLFEQTNWSYCETNRDNCKPNKTLWVKKRFLCALLHHNQALYCRVLTTIMYNLLTKLKLITKIIKKSNLTQTVRIDMTCHNLKNHRCPMTGPSNFKILWQIISFGENNYIHYLNFEPIRRNLNSYLCNLCGCCKTIFFRRQFKDTQIRVGRYIDKTRKKYP